MKKTVTPFCHAFTASHVPNGQHSKHTSGFTRIDMGMTICALIFVTWCCLPMLANTRLRNERIVCIANLQAIGRAFNQWSAEHEGRYPFVVDTNFGGVRLHALSPNAWFQYAALSNELASPRVLACPSDPETRAALEFSGSSNGGFYHPTYRNNALSYFIGVHASPFAPRVILAGDRNVPYHRVNENCGTPQLINLIGIYATSDAPSPWNPGNHGPLSGNVLFAGGEVIEASGRDVKKAVATAEPEWNITHALLPR